MKHILLPAVFVMAMLLGCHSGGDKQYKTSSTGSPYEIVVVSTDGLWQGAVGDTLCAILEQESPMLNQPEPLFDVVHTTPERFGNVLLRHRNIIRIDISPSASTGIDVAYDVDAAPQIVLMMHSFNADTLADYLWRHADRITDLLNDTEIERFAARARKFPDKSVADSVRAMFGINMTIPRGYQIRNSIPPDFMWISYETPLTSQGIVIYTYPVDTAFRFGVNEIVAQRNAFTALIPGPSDGSYMTTSTYIPPVIRPVVIDGRTWAEVRGFWDVEGDFMGGPFVSYTTIDKARGRAVTIDEYVYSPKQSKGRRNFMRQMESIVRNVTF